MTVIQPADVHAHVLLLHAELERIRAELGRPRDERARYPITGATPREVHLAACALFGRAQRFAVEHTGEQIAAPAPPAIEAAEPAHVFAMVGAALTGVLKVKARLGIGDTVAPVAADRSKQPSDCLAAILVVDRQLDRMLARPYLPGDVDAELVLAGGYAASLCGAAGVGIPPVPPLVPKKRPGDVLGRIAAALRALRPAVTAGGGTMVELGESPISIDDVVPSDCFDLAVLVAGELALLHAARKLPPPSLAYHPSVGSRLPSHCYQHAAHLEAVAVVLAKT